MQELFINTSKEIVMETNTYTQVETLNVLGQPAAVCLLLWPDGFDLVYMVNKLCRENASFG